MPLEIRFKVLECSLNFIIGKAVSEMRPDSWGSEILGGTKQQRRLMFSGPVAATTEKGEMNEIVLAAVFAGNEVLQANNMKVVKRMQNACNLPFRLFVKSLLY